MTEPPDPAMLSLHRAWVTADGIRERMLLDVQIREDGSGLTALPAQLIENGQWYSRILAMSVFYGLLFVVAEGYQELKLADETVDSLLVQRGHVDLLRRFRNGVFHFHKDPLDDRLVAFLTADESATWVKALYAAFKAFFEHELPIRDDLQHLADLSS